MEIRPAFLEFRCQSSEQEFIKELIQESTDIINLFELLKENNISYHIRIIPEFLSQDPYVGQLINKLDSDINLDSKNDICNFIIDELFENKFIKKQEPCL